jgi:hypothetical protein
LLEFLLKFLFLLRDRINDSPRSGETFPRYSHYALKNANITYFSNETFQTNQFVPLELFLKQNSNRRKFGSTIFIEKFKTKNLTMGNTHCLDQRGHPFADGLCLFHLILESCCVEVNLNSESHQLCPGYDFPGNYSILDSNKGEFTVRSELLIREMNDPFSWVYKVTNGSLSFGTPSNLVLYITGNIFVILSLIILFFSGICIFSLVGGWFCLICLDSLPKMVKL